MRPPQIQAGKLVNGVSEDSREITAAATSIALFVGWAVNGSVDRARNIKSIADFDWEYGGLNFDSYLGFAAHQFFENGGADAYVVRLAATGADGTHAATVATTTIAGLKIAASSPREWGRQAKPGHGASSRMGAATAGGALGCCHRSSVSMTIMWRPQHGHGGR